MKCAICNEETIGTNAKMWGCDFAHVTCIKAYSLGTNDTRAAVQAAQPEPMSAPTAEPDERAMFELELRKQCFQKPTSEAYDLAWSMWQARAAMKGAQHE